MTDAIITLPVLPVPVMRELGEDANLYVGDVLESLRSMPSGIVQTCVTSPPYWGLRDYGVSGQLGLEETPQEYVDKMVLVFREVRRVLRDDGTLWLNIGDSYASGGCGTSERYRKMRGDKTATAQNLPPKFAPEGMKPKDLVGIPWMLAFALRADGWYLRQEIIWNKPNPMPESVTDRCTKSHESIFLLTKSKDYFYDNVAIAEQASDDANRDVVTTRNKRSVWTITPRGYKGAHFATFPPELPELCIRAGTSEKGCCSACGAPLKRIVDKKRTATRPGTDTKTDGVAEEAKGNRDPERHVTKSVTVGWETTCRCISSPVPCVVMDPFVGSGTTMAVAHALGRLSIGCELNEKYVPLIEDRLANSATILRKPKTKKTAEPV